MAGSNLGLTPELFQQMLLKMGVGAGKPPGSPQIPQGMPGTGPTGGPPQMNAPTPGMGGAMPGAGPSAVPPVAPQIPPRQGTGPGMRTGPYTNSADRAEALTGNAIQSLSGFVNQAKERKEAHTRAQAENYMVQLINAQQALKENPQDKGAQAVVDMITHDQKIQKTFEKGLDFIFPKEPGEPAPPEAHGILSGIKKALGIQPKGQQQPQGQPQGGGGAMGPHGFAPGSPLAPSGPTPQQIQQMIQQQQLAQQAQTNQLKAAAGTTPQEYKQQAAVKAGTAASADAILHANNALDVERLRIKAQGYTVVVSGLLPVVKGPTGEMYSYGDKNAPPEVQKLLKGEHDGLKAKYGEEMSREIQREGATYARMMQTQKFRNNIAAKTSLKPLFDARATLSIAQTALPSALKGDMQAQSQILNGFLRSGGLPTNKAMWDQAAKQAPLLQRLGSMLITDPATGNITDIALTAPIPPDEINKMVTGAQRAYHEKYGQGVAQAGQYGVDITSAPGFEYLKPPSLDQPATKAATGPGANKKAEAATPPTLKRKGPGANKQNVIVVSPEDMNAATNSGAGR